MSRRRVRRSLARRCPPALSLCVALCVAPGAGAAPAAQRYRLVDLGPATLAIAINAGGEVVGMRNGQAATWSKGAWTPFKPTSLQYNARPVAINAAGSTAGSENAQATVWWPSGKAKFIPVSGPSGTFAVDITDDSTVLVQTLDQGIPHATTWRQGVETPVPDPDFVQFGVTVVAMNARHQIAGHGGDHATSILRYTDGTWEFIGGLGGLEAHAAAINDAGHIAGGCSIPDDDSHACLFDGASMVDLGTLGGLVSDAHGLDARDEVVGNSQDAAGTWHAFLYAQGRMTMLSDRVVDARGLSLDDAVGINDAGRIAGNGTLGGVAHAFVLVPLVPLVPLALAGPK